MGRCSQLAVVQASVNIGRIAPAAVCAEDRPPPADRGAKGRADGGAPTVAPLPVAGRLSADCSGEKEPRTARADRAPGTLRERIAQLRRLRVSEYVGVLARSTRVTF